MRFAIDPNVSTNEYPLCEGADCWSGMQARPQVAPVMPGTRAQGRRRLRLVPLKEAVR
jgi:hypothetical protein